MLMKMGEDIHTLKTLINCSKAVGLGMKAETIKYNVHVSLSESRTRL